MMIVLLALTSVFGVMLRKLFGRWFEDHYTEITLRLFGVAGVLLIDIVTSWLLLKENHKKSDDRRKHPIRPESYFFIRLVGALTLWVGVVIGYLTDQT